MANKLVELFNRCKKHNITISIKPSLPDDSIDIRGECLSYVRELDDYEILRVTNRISISTLERYSSIYTDVMEHEINNIFFELMRKRKMGPNDTEEFCDGYRNTLKQDGVSVFVDRWKHLENSKKED